MGAPKKKWRPEEEEALKAGTAKYGEGKWSAILKDPVFGPILHSRSNIDLKDKWRNVTAAAIGLGSRHKARLVLKNSLKATNHDDKALTIMVEREINVVNVEPLTVVSGSSEDYEPDSSEKPVSRLDNLVLDAITKLNEPRGSTRAAIATYIKGKHIAPPNLERLVADSLELLTENGNLVKVKHQYRIAPPTGTLVVEPDTSKSALEENQKKAPNVDNNRIPSRSEIDVELQKMKSMSAREAAAAAAQAVAEAEALIAEAEQAEREAKQAEAYAEAAQRFAEAAISALKYRTVCT